MKILVAGGAGYIGSQMVRELLNGKYECIIFDNLSTGYERLIPEQATFIKGDLLSKQDLTKAFRGHKFDAVMHFAAYSIVSESVTFPLKYYENNVSACINLLNTMIENSVTKFIFSSTAAVYGEPERVPIKEDDRTCPTNPYGTSKLMIENILKDTSSSHELSYTSLRYFNAAGAYPSGKAGELHDPETHLIPNILKVASGKKEEVTIYGNDYPTPDGTCVRDFIHVQDLCRAHLLALKALFSGMRSDVYNLGNGNGYSVMEVVQMAERVTGKKINFIMGNKRPGDPARLVASSDKAKSVLGWSAQESLETIIKTAWEWEQNS